MSTSLSNSQEEKALYFKKQFNPLKKSNPNILGEI